MRCGVMRRVGTSDYSGVETIRDPHLERA